MNRAEIFYFCACKRLIKHSIFLLMIACLVQMVSKLSGDCSAQHPGKNQPFKSNTVWAILSDFSADQAEITQETENEQAEFVLSVKPKQMFLNDSQLFFCYLSVLNEGHIPLHITDSSPPSC